MLDTPHVNQAFYPYFQGCQYKTIPPESAPDFVTGPAAPELAAIPLPKTEFPINARNSAYFREIIGDRVRISIGKRMTKKGAFLAVFF